MQYSSVPSWEIRSFTEYLWYLQSWNVTVIIKSCDINLQPGICNTLCYVLVLVIAHKIAFIAKKQRRGFIVKKKKKWLQCSWITVMSCCLPPVVVFKLIKPVMAARGYHVLCAQTTSNIIMKVAWIALRTCLPFFIVLHLYIMIQAGQHLWKIFTHFIDFKKQKSFLCYWDG